MKWENDIRDFEFYLTLEKRLSKNTTVGYLSDIRSFAQYIENEVGCSSEQVESRHIEAFLAQAIDSKKAKSSQSRLLSSLRSFFNFLLSQERIEHLPTEFVENPKVGRKLPNVLSIEEIDRIVDGIDLSEKFGHRNHAIIETLYGCGLRVSELTSLRISDLFFNEGFIRVIGKGNKQRLVPISQSAIKSIELYLGQRGQTAGKSPHQDIVFLNNNGGPLSRVMIFYIVRESAQVAGINKQISPHTFRHSFATHLLEGGVDIRQLQDMLGHESIITTEIYTHLDRKHLRNALETFHPLSTKNNL